MKVREMELYSEKVKEDDIRNLLGQIVKSRLPLFGFLDFSDLFSMNYVNLIITRKNNTVKFFVKERRHLHNLSALLFPFKLSEPTEVQYAKAPISVPPRFYILGGRHDFLDFMLKENVLELHLHLSRFLGGDFSIGSATYENGRKGIIIVPNPSRFLVVDLEKNPSIYIELLEPIPKRMSTTSRFPAFEETGMTLGVDNYDPFQHSMVVGASGTGKSKALYILLRAMEEMNRDNVRMIILDPHGEFARMYKNRAKIVNFVSNYVEPLDMGGNKTPLMTQLIAQLVSSTIGQENKYSERVLFYAVHLLTAIEKLDLSNIAALLTDSSVRAEFVSSCDNDEVKRFFDEEFNDIYIHHFNDAILPILNFVGEYKLYLGKTMKQESLLNLLRSNRVTVVSFDPHFFGKRMISFLAGAVINQMYILAITGQLQDKPTILAIDEFGRVETKVTRDILIETRKFNLSLYLSIQYLNQLSKEVYDSIIGNVRNIIAFKLSRQDATSLSSIMEIKIEEFFKKSRSQTELEESKKEMFVRLHQRECIVRFFDGKKYMLPMKVKAVDAKKWGWNESMEVKEARFDENNENGPSQPPAAGASHPNEQSPASRSASGQPAGGRAASGQEEGQPFAHARANEGHSKLHLSKEEGEAGAAPQPEEQGSPFHRLKDAAERPSHHGRVPSGLRKKEKKEE